MGRIRTCLHRFCRARSGTALVEFALALPLMVVVSYVSIDGLRLMWSFQAATAGVHEAARYIARVAPGDICATGGSLAGYQDALRVMVGQSRDGAAVFGRDARLVSLEARLDCVTGAGLRQAVVPVATVRAEVALFLPMHRLLAGLGAPGAAVFTARIEEQARIFGL